MFDKNSGYNGYSMSKRAAAAYNGGEKPKSKWTKKAMLEVIDECLKEKGLKLTIDLKSLKKDEIFDKYFAYSSYHHTSKMCNVTNFYKLDHAALENITKPMSDDEIIKIEEEERDKVRKEINAIKEEEKRKIDEDRKIKEFNQTHDYEFGSVEHFINANPQLVEVRFGKNGKKIFKCTFPKFNRTIEYPEDQLKCYCYFWNPKI